MEHWTSREIAGLSTKSRVNLVGKRGKKRPCYIAFISSPGCDPKGA